MNHDSQTIFGVHAVQARLQTGIGIERLIIRPGKLNNRLSHLIELAELIGCPIERRAIDDEATDVAHQGVALMVSGTAMRPESDLKLMLSRENAQWLFLVLDGVTDPRNLGACVRSAATFGVSAIIVPKDNSAALNDAAIKTASGGANLVPVIQVVNLARTIDHLKNAGVWIAGAVVDEAGPISEADLKGNLAIVMGSEDAGLRRKTRERCDFLVQVPMVNPDLGLNVSVAAGICLYGVQRQRSS